MWQLSDKLRMASLRLSSPIYEPSGKRCSQMPESSGPRCACTCVILASVSLSPQLTKPLIPHMSALVPFGTEFVNFCFGVEHLDRLKTTVDQARNPVQKAQPQKITIQKQQYWGTRDREHLLLQPTAALRLCTEEHRRDLTFIFLALEQDASLPVRVFVVLLNVTRQ